MRARHKTPSPEAEAVRDLAEGLLTTNLKQGHDGSLGFDYSYVCPSPQASPWQWSLDSCCHAIAIAHVDPEQAQRELETLIATQAEDGFIGHVYFWSVRLAGLGRPWSYGQAPPGERLRRSAIIHPPLLAQAVERVAEITGDAAFAPPFMGALDLYHNWLAVNRAPDPDGLLVIVSPVESGAPRSPAYDAVTGMSGKTGRWRLGAKDRWLEMRNWFSGYDSETMLRKARFYVKDSMVNGLYADSLAAMARLHRSQGNTHTADAYEARSNQVAQSILSKMLDRTRGGFMSLVGKDERRVQPLTVGSLAPLMLDAVPHDIATEIIERHVLNRDEFWLRYPVPSVAANEPTFSPRESRLTWRGPAALQTTWMVWRGLHIHGFHEAADTLAVRTVGLVAQAGFREFYNPLNGQGMGARDYGPAALALDMADPW